VDKNFLHKKEMRRSINVITLKWYLKIEYKLIDTPLILLLYSGYGIDANPAILKHNQIVAVL